MLPLANGTMAYQTGSFDATLAAAAGDDPALRAELCLAFEDSLSQQLDLLQRARCDGNWTLAAQRLKGLAASFHADELLAISERVLASAPGEPRAIGEVRAFLDGFSA